MSSGFIHDVEVSTFLFYGWVRVSRVSDVLGLSIRLCWILEGFCLLAIVNYAAVNVSTYEYLSESLFSVLWGAGELGAES